MGELEKNLKLIRRIYSKRGSAEHKIATIEDHLNSLESEIEELKEGLAKQDYFNVQEEIGDILWIAIALGVLAERDGFTTFNKILRMSNHKTVFRNPHVFGKEKITDVEKVREIRAQAKAAYKELLKKRSLRKNQTGLRNVF